MPHFPNPGAGIPFELRPPPQQRPSQPVTPTAATAAPAGRRPGTVRVSPELLSIYGHQTDLNRVIKHLMGKEPHVDEHTRATMLDSGLAARPPS